jgi:hypothetical protein
MFTCVHKIWMYLSSHAAEHLSLYGPSLSCLGRPHACSPLCHSWSVLPSSGVHSHCWPGLQRMVIKQKPCKHCPFSSGARVVRNERGTWSAWSAAQASVQHRLPTVWSLPHKGTLNCHPAFTVCLYCRCKWIIKIRALNCTGEVWINKPTPAVCLLCKDPGYPVLRALWGSRVPSPANMRWSREKAEGCPATWHLKSESHQTIMTKCEGDQRNTKPYKIVITHCTTSNQNRGEWREVTDPRKRGRGRAGKARWTENTNWKEGWV